MVAKAGIKTGIVILLGLAACLAVLRAADAIRELGLREADARESVIEAINSGNVNWWPASKAFKAAAPAVRAGLVTGALTWAKTYTESAEFKTAYEKVRQNQKPEAPKPKSADEEMAKQRAQLEKSIAETKKRLAEPPPAGVSPEIAKAIRDGSESALKMLTAQLADMDKPETKAMLRQSIEYQNKNSQEQYQRSMKEWESRYPIDPKPLLVKRLQHFLDQSAGVDFGAKLVPCGSKKCFADKPNEQKPQDWKLCYRAGKGAVDAARAFATTWLAELQKK
jgi:hypothetical protein